VRNDKIRDHGEDLYCNGIHNSDGKAHMMRFELEGVGDDAVMMEGLFNLKDEEDSEWVRLFSVRDNGIALWNPRK
jgi:hypothetical protein